MRVWPTAAAGADGSFHHVYAPVPDHRELAAAAHAEAQAWEDRRGEGAGGAGGRRAALVLLGVAGLLAVAVVALLPASSSSTSSLALSSDESASSAVHATANTDTDSGTGKAAVAMGTTKYVVQSRNAYGAQPGAVVQGQYPHAFVLEPYRETEIFLVPTHTDTPPSATTTASKTRTSNKAIISGKDVASIKWSTDGGDTTTGFSMRTTCTKAVTTQTITATITELDGTVETTSVEATCIYVRRALTDLTSEDKEIFLDAMETVYRIEREDGIAQYGDDFMNIDDFQMLHLDGAGRIECDGWHDNAGVFPQHSAFTLLFEQNLQRIDPSIALAHWDYFLDGDDTAYGDLESFAALQEFGNFRTFDEEHPYEITKGRFANLAVRPAREGFDVKSPYGLLRAPWNIDPVPTIKRYPGIFGQEFALFYIPNCARMLDCYDSADFEHFSTCAADVVHGPVHVNIGGEIAPTAAFQAKVDTLLGERSFEGGPLVTEHTMIFKRFWRHGFTRCPTDCDASVDSLETCTCIVSDAMRAKYTPGQMLEAIGIADVFEAAGVDTTPDNDAEEQVLQLLLDVFGSPGLTGEMFTSSTPGDPTFWLVHSTSERLYHLMQDEVEKGTRDFDLTWGYVEHGAMTEDPYVCDWSDVDLEDETALPVCTEATCTGHNEDDVLTMGNFLGKGETYTNAEYLSLLHLKNTERPYMYENLQLNCA